MIITISAVVIGAICSMGIIELVKDFRNKKK